jgi:uncharacterized protein YjbI with pentapeptide repeats
VATVHEAFAGAQLQNCDLSNFDLLGTLRGADLEGAILDDASVDGIDLTHANLTRASAVGATFQGSAFEGAQIDDADFSSADLTDAYIEDFTGPGENPEGAGSATWSHTRCPNRLDSDTLPDGCKGTFTGSDCRILTETYWTDDGAGFQLQNCYLEASSFVDADLTGADFSGAVLDGSSFDGADLTDAQLVEVSAVGASFVGANFTHTDVTGSDFTGTDLTGAYSTVPYVEGADDVNWTGAVCPDGLDADLLPNGCAGHFLAGPAGPGAVPARREDIDA